MVVTEEENDGGGDLDFESSQVAAKDPSGWFLDCLDMVNFKSYLGQVRVGPLKQFMAIIGCNGSGKSNLMDAISFVMGERAESLRVRRLNELIHGASFGKPVSSSASVTAIFKLNAEDGNRQLEKRFTRVIRGASSEYHFDGSVVSRKRYFDELKEIGINPKGKNFLVFQGAIESIAMKSSKERTLLLEEICGSGALKAEYETAKAKVEEADHKTEMAFIKKKSVISERRNTKLELQEAEKFNKLVQQLSEKEIELHLFNLYYIRSEIDQLSIEYLRRTGQVKIAEKKKREAEKLIGRKRKELEELNRLLISSEAGFKQIENEKESKIPKLKLIEVQEKLKHLERKLVLIERSLKQAKEQKRCEEKDIENLRKMLKDTERKERDLQAQIAESGVEEQANVTFRESQINEYWDLKKRTITENAKEQKEKDELEKKQKGRKDIFDSLSREKKALDVKLELLEHEMKEKKRLGEKLYDTIQELDASLKAKEAEARPLRDRITDAEGRVGTLQRELEKVTSEIDGMRMDRYDMKRRDRKNEVLRSLFAHFRGVKGRVSQLCKIRHSKYNVALTKIIGSSMDAIVVDNEKTARDCIQYLKEQMIEPEVFLPLDLLDVKPLKTRFRDYDGDDIKLAYDLVEFDRELEKAILYCVGSHVVCRTSELASKVAAGEIFRETTNAVSLDGTLYAKSGIISGGQADLERKARRWNDADLEKRDSRRLRIREELMEVMKTLRDRMSLEEMEQDIECLKNRLKYVNRDFEKYVVSAKELDKQKVETEKQIEDVSSRWDEAKAALSQIDAKLNVVVQRMNATEDGIFAEFCQQVGIPNIRAYEERDVRAHGEFMRQKSELQNEIERIKALITFQSDSLENCDANVKRWEKNALEVKKELKECRKKEEEMLADITIYEKELEKQREEVNEIKNRVEEKSKEIKQETRSLNQLDKALLAGQKSAMNLMNSVLQKKMERSEMLTHIKVSGINVPLISGSLDDIEVEDSELNPANDSPEAGADTQEQRFVINYEALSAALRDYENPEDISKARQKIEDELRELEKNIASIEAPHLKAAQRWEEVNSKARALQTEFDEIRKQSKAAHAEFQKIKTERHRRFMSCFEKISKDIDGIYKALTQSESAQAVLGLNNPEEPFLDGVSYHCVAPGKRFQAMENMSGGEKTLAALALLFAIRSYEPAPFFVLDEVDAALDRTNIGKVTSYIKREKENVQILVISLKEELFAHADALIGITLAVEESEVMRSALLTLDLSQYVDDAMEEE